MPTRRGKPGMTFELTSSLTLPSRLAARSPGRDFLKTPQKNAEPRVGRDFRSVVLLASIYSRRL